MIASNLTDTIREQLSSAVTIMSSSGGEVAISMPFSFDDGDPYDFKLLQTQAGEWLLHDSGHTVRRASYQGADLTAEGHVERFRQIVGFYGLKETQGDLSMPVDLESIGASLYAFTQACLESVTLARMPKERTAEAKPNFAKRFAKLIESVVPHDRLQPHWHDPQLDPERVYVADYRIRGRKRDWHLFGIPTAYAGLGATVTCMHYKQMGDFNCLAVYDHEERLPTRVTIPLNATVDRRFPRISERSIIRDFLQEQIA